MTRLLETIKCLDGFVFNLPYHQSRVNTSRSQLGFDTAMDLKLSPPQEGLYRCRIIYSQAIEQIEYLPYTAKKIQRFKCLDSDISYALKYENREEINALYEKRDGADEIIIVKNGLLTDTSIANICVYDGKEWLTPKDPLLKGTTRQRYLDSGKIRTADIHVKDLTGFSKIALMNAMVDFYVIEDAIIL